MPLLDYIFFELIRDQIDHEGGAGMVIRIDDVVMSPLSEIGFIETIHYAQSAKELCSFGMHPRHDRMLTALRLAREQERV
jgi:hypothetical protein